MSVRGRRHATAVPAMPDEPASDASRIKWPQLAQELARLAGNAPPDDAGPVLSTALDEILSSVGADFAMAARREHDRLVCVAQSGAPDPRLTPGTDMPFRWREGADSGPAVFLVGREAAPEPLGEYLLVAGFRTAVAVSLGPATEASGVVLLAFREDEALDAEEADDLATALQPLDRLLINIGTNPPPEERQALIEHAQKMEALGSMAGMIAHDFNNLLTTILGYTSIIKNTGRLHRDDAEFLDQVEEATHRAADLTARLLAFARGGVMRSGPLDLRAVVVDTIRLASTALQNRVTLTTDLADIAVPINGDEGQLQQCLLNILLNARDAMPDGGNVVVAVHRHSHSAVVSIADDGPGIDEATRKRIFEPYFTTKPKGSGTGLGLAIAYGVVQGHGGDIQVGSKPGAGTTFTIRLPALPELPPAADVTRMAAADRDLVLVVDDDEMVRRTTMHTVAHLGYNVVDAASGRTAIELVRARPERFAVVLLDLVMPELTGAQTFKELRRIRESLPVVVCTGYAADAHLDDAVRSQIAGLIHKPFTPARIAETLESLQVRRARP